MCGWLGVCLAREREREISIGMVQLMLFYWSLRPEPINTKVKGQQLGNNDSILMMFVQVCVHTYVCVCVCVCVCVHQCTSTRCLSAHLLCGSGCSCVRRAVCECLHLCVCIDMCIHAAALARECVFVFAAIILGVDDLWSVLWLPQGTYKTTEWPFIAFLLCLVQRFIHHSVFFFFPCLALSLSFFVSNSLSPISISFLFLRLSLSALLYLSLICSGSFL